MSTEEITATSYETRLEKKLRQWKYLLPAATFFTIGVLVAGIYTCMLFFESGYYYSIIVAGFLYHAAMIVGVHDGAHKAITKTTADSWIMSIVGGIVLLPFYPEPFRRYHLIHHANTNSEADPLWPNLKKKIFERSRLLYILAELIPFGFIAITIFSDKETKRKVNGPKIRFGFMALSFLISFVIIYFVKLDAIFIISSMYFATIVAKLRHWCEHIGDIPHKESNTYWFPLGMGIGNHDVHHDHPNYSWLTLLIGLRKRKKDTHPLKAIYRILFDKNYIHYGGISDS
ncbi:MAG: fatty acid desaturase [Bacteroidota bacterium]|nr:fatty acid desaturase [Bacteroidota bacterium]